MPNHQHPAAHPPRGAVRRRHPGRLGGPDPPGPL